MVLSTEKWHRPRWDGLRAEGARLWCQGQAGLEQVPGGRWLLGCGVPLLVLAGVQWVLAGLGLGWLVNLLALLVLLELRPILLELRRGLGPVGQTSDSESVRTLLERVWTRAFALCFCTSFWYWVLPGALGLVLVRATQWLAQGEHSDAGARRLQGLLEWLPARLLGLTLALVGNFEEVIYLWRSISTGLGSGIWVATLAQGALGFQHHAVNDEEMLEDEEMALGTEALLWRALVVWAGVAALVAALRS